MLTACFNALVDFLVLRLKKIERALAWAVPAALALFSAVRFALGHPAPLRVPTFVGLVLIGAWYGRFLHRRSLGKAARLGSGYLKDDAVDPHQQLEDFIAILGGLALIAVAFVGVVRDLCA